MAQDEGSGQEPNVEAGGTQGEVTQGAGRASRGPAVHAGGDKEMGGPVPMTPGPYEERKHSADDLDSPSAPSAEGVNPGPGATKPQRADSGLISEDPDETPRGRVASPADEQPASEMAGQTGEAVTATGPAHHPGTARGEDYAEGEESPERGRHEVLPEQGREKLA